MKITVLVENNSRIDNYLFAEPALSLLIEHKDNKILFDTGYSDIFLRNAKTLNIDLNSITDIVLSHGHNDHTGGLRFLCSNTSNIKLIAHPNIFDEKFETDGTPYGHEHPYLLHQEYHTNKRLGLLKTAHAHFHICMSNFLLDHVSCLAHKGNSRTHYVLLWHETSA